MMPWSDLQGDDDGVAILAGERRHGVAMLGGPDAWLVGWLVRVGVLEAEALWAFGLVSFSSDVVLGLVVCYFCVVIVDLLFVLQHRPCRPLANGSVQCSFQRGGSRRQCAPPSVLVLMTSTLAYGGGLDVDCGYHRKVFMRVTLP